MNKHKLPIKVLYWDLETSPMDVFIRTYQLKQYNPYIHHENIVRDWNILGAAWCWWGEKKIHNITVDPADPTDDYEIVKQLREVLAEADCIVGHNSDAFDLKMFNTRLIYHNLDPLPPIKTIDTIKIARSTFRFPSNSMAFIARYLKLDLKGKSPDWDKVLAGCPVEIKKMGKYNVQDIKTGFQIYERLAPYMKNHPDFRLLAGIYDKNELRCKCCGSTNVQKRGFLNFKPGKKQRFQCVDCGSWGRSDAYFKPADPILAANPPAVLK